MPRHVVSYRPLEGEERDQLTTPPIAKTDEWGCAVSVLAVAALLGCALGAALQVVFQAAIRIRFLPLVTMALLTFIAWRVAGAIRRTERERLQRQAQDREEDAVEVMEVWNAVAVRYHGDPPTFVLDIGGGKLLITRTDAFRDVTVIRFGQGRPVMAADGSTLDASTVPILSSHFVLHRGRRSGRILRVEVIGEPIAVRAAALPNKLRVGANIHIVDGSLDTLT